MGWKFNTSEEEWGEERKGELELPRARWWIYARYNSVNKREWRKRCLRCRGRSARRASRKLWWRVAAGNGTPPSLLVVSSEPAGIGRRILLGPKSFSSKLFSKRILRATDEFEERRNTRLSTKIRDCILNPD